MKNANGYWPGYWRRRLSRRCLLSTAALGAASLATAAVLGCEEEGGPAATTPAGTGSPAAATPVTYPPKPAYSAASVQRLAEEYHWSRIGPQVQSLGTPRKGGVLALPGLNPVSFHPAEEVVGPIGQWRFGFTHSNLVTVDMHYTAEGGPDLAPITTRYALSQSFETPDAQTFIFKLRPGITFQPLPPADGAPLTIDDIRATYQYFLNWRFHKPNFQMIKSIEEPQSGTIKITATEPAAQLLSALRNPPYGVQNRKVLEQPDEWLKTHGVGTGAFMLKKFAPSGAFVLQRNPNWWYPKDQFGNQLPYMDGIAMTVITDAAATLAAVRSGNIDYYRPFSAEEFQRLLGELDVWGQVRVVSCSCFQPLLCTSMRTPEFRDPRVRRAVSLAIDRPKVIDAVYGGAAAAQDFIPWYYRGRPWPDSFQDMGQWFRYDPEGAKSLLREAGVQTPWKVEFYFPSQITAGGGTFSVGPTAEAYMQNLKAVGIDVDLKPLDSLAVNRTAFGGEWKGILNFNDTSGIGIDADRWVQAAITGSGTNPNGVSDPKVDEMFLKQRATVNNKEREKIFQDIEDYVNRDMLLRGATLPDQFGYAIWRKYLHNVIEGASWSLNGANQLYADAWLDERAPSRNLDAF